MKPKVVIADDEELVREFIKSVISFLDYEVVGEIRHGNEAIAIINQKKPDILLLDINMPGKTGLEILDEMGEEVRKTCVIMLTAVADTDSVRESLAKGASYFLRKDNTIEKMTEVIQKTWKNYLHKK